MNAVSIGEEGQPQLIARSDIIEDTTSAQAVSPLTECFQYSNQSRADYS